MLAGHMFSIDIYDQLNLLKDGIGGAKRHISAFPTFSELLGFRAQGLGFRV
jgi:hypothetical protein